MQCGTRIGNAVEKGYSEKLGSTRSLNFKFSLLDIKGYRLLLFCADSQARQFYPASRRESPIGCLKESSLQGLFRPPNPIVKPVAVFSGVAPNRNPRTPPR